MDDEQVAASIREGFDAVDDDHTGRISIYQLGQVLSQMSRKQEIPESIIKDIAASSDADQSGCISFEEFRDAVMGMTNIVFILIMDKASDRFLMYDVDQDGKLNAQELQEFVDSLPEHRKPQNVEGIIATCDRNGDGVIDFDEFIRAILNNQ